MAGEESTGKRRSRSEKRLTHSSEPVYNISPSYSPDGTKITWQRNDNIWVDADGTGQERLTSGPAEDITPAFSPDGRKVAFSRSRPGEDDAGIWVKKLKGAKTQSGLPPKTTATTSTGPSSGPTVAG